MELFQDPSFPKTKGYYFAAAAVAAESQGEGLYGQMNKMRLAEAIGNGYKFTPLIFTRTQNPLVETAIRKELEQYPKNGRYRGFSLERRLVKGVYGQLLTNDLPPRSSDESIQHAYDGLDALNGDAYVLLFHLEYDRTMNPDGAAYFP